MCVCVCLFLKIKNKKKIKKNKKKKGNERQVCDVPCVSYERRITLAMDIKLYYIAFEKQELLTPFPLHVISPMNTTNEQLVPPSLKSYHDF